MSIPKNNSARFALLTPLIGIVVLGLGLVGIGLASNELTVDSPSPDIVTITATGLEFDAPREISSGWTTLRFENKSGMTHFALLERMPEGFGIEEQQTEVAPLFQRGFELLAAGQSEKANAEFGKLPEWFGDIVFFGGPGLVGPKQTAQTTLNLTPGTYLIECYVKTNGVFHSYNPIAGEYGMVREITVTEASSGAAAPQADVELSISSEQGIVQTDDTPLPPGRHTIAVHFEGQTTHENFVGHDVHLVQLGSSTDVAEVADWMDWTQVHGLETPAPASFVGGINEMPEGETAYFTVDVSAGQYAWIAEVPNPSQKDMLKQFTVPSESKAASQEGK